jgi:hypothetical protein
MQSEANALAAPSVNDTQARSIVEQRSVQDTLNARQCFLDGMPVQIQFHFTSVGIRWDPQRGHLPWGIHEVGSACFGNWSRNLIPVQTPGALPDLHKDLAAGPHLLYNAAAVRRLDSLTDFKLLSHGWISFAGRAPERWPQSTSGRDSGGYQGMAEHELSTKGAGASDEAATPEEIAKLVKEIGGRQEARTPDLRVANAALSQLS